MKKSVFLILLGLFAACAKPALLTSTRNGEDALRECKKIGDNKDYDRAIECFELLKSRFSGSRQAFEADLEIGDIYFRKGDYLLASETYQAFIKLHPTHEKIGYAYYRLGLSYLRESPKAIDRDQQYLQSAIDYLGTAVSLNTGDLKELSQDKLREARTRIAKRFFYIGRFYHRTGEYLSAIPRLQDIVTQYSGLGLDEKALYLLGDCYQELSQKDKVLEILGVFDQHFPRSPYRKKLAQNLGVSS